MIRSSPHHQQKGSVVLVALCFLAVLGIALASYLAVSNQAMKLSNRSYQQSISAQLAEIGIEQTLWAFNHNNWDPSAWTITGTTASRTITFPNTKYGNGVTGTINLRVDNYNAPILATQWNSIPRNLNDVVSYNQTSPWNSGTAYNVNDVVNSAGTKFRCILAHTGQSPPNITYWATTTDFTDFRVWYRCKSSGPSSTVPPDSTDWVNSTPVIYSEGVATPTITSGAAVTTQLRALISIAPLFPNAAGATSTLSLNGAPSGTVDSYNSDSDADISTPAVNYGVGPGAVTSSAVLAAENSTSTAVTLINTAVRGYVAASPATAFPSAPLFSYGGSTSLRGPLPFPGVDLHRVSRSPYVPQFDPTTWDAFTRYRPNDVARAADGKLYICLSSNLNQQPPNGNWSDGGPSLIAGSGPVSIGTAGAPSPSLYHIDGNLSLPTATDILKIDGPVILDIHGDISISAGKIMVTNFGSAEVIFAGQLQVDSTGGGIDNTTTIDPKKFLLVRSSTNLTPTGGHYFNSSIKFYGAIYMPRCSLAVNPPSSGTRIYGAVSADNITFSNTFRLHYDTSLRTATFRSVDTPYVVTEWRELTDPAEKVVLP